MCDYQEYKQAMGVNYQYQVYLNTRLPLTTPRIDANLLVCQVRNILEDALQRGDAASILGPAMGYKVPFDIKEWVLSYAVRIGTVILIYLVQRGDRTSSRGMDMDRQDI